MRLRQVALVAQELEPVVEDLSRELGVGVTYRDPGVGEFGLHNALLTLGDTFLEVVSPTKAGTTAGRYLERRGGDGGYMVILQCDDLDADRTRVADLGIRVVWSVDLPDMRGTHLHPADVGGAILSLDWADPPAAWRWAGPDWQPNDAGEITAVDIQSDDPDKLAARWSEVLDRPVAPSDGGGVAIALDRGTIRFVAATDGRGDGVSGLEVGRGQGQDGTVDVAGIRLRFR
ncbi:MAG: hypothetical protein QOG64_229 [Acidimicrobiaceae bacterium]|nr:hypothetical protein [Acidimicrobiaceae bacterium]